MNNFAIENDIDDIDPFDYLDEEDEEIDENVDYSEDIEIEDNYYNQDVYDFGLDADYSRFNNFSNEDILL